LFNTVFRIDNPRLFKEDKGIRLVAQIVGPATLAADAELQMAKVTPPELKSSKQVMDAAEMPESDEDLWRPRPLPREVISRENLKVEEASSTERGEGLELQKQKGAKSAASSIGTKEESQSLRIDDQLNAPYHMSGSLRARRVIRAPALPEYPEWALVAAVELELKISLSVDENGDPYQVFILDGCGDSTTDLQVLEYVEAMRFEPSFGVSRGVMEWEFRLER
jgi:TonB family protein